MTNSTFIFSLRQIADFYETHPELPIPFLSEINGYVTTKEELKQVANNLGSCHKTYNNSLFTLSKEFGEILLSFHAGREQVCERVVIGKKMVEKEIVIATEKKMVEEEIVEWKCTDTSLLKGKEEMKQLNSEIIHELV